MTSVLKSFGVISKFPLNRGGIVKQYTPFLTRLYKDRMASSKADLSLQFTCFLIINLIYLIYVANLMGGWFDLISY